MPDERTELERQHKEYAQRHHGEDYADVQRMKREQWVKEDQRHQARTAMKTTAPTAPKIKKPWTPDDLVESITTGVVDS